MPGGGLLLLEEGLLLLERPLLLGGGLLPLAVGFLRGLCHVSWVMMHGDFNRKRFQWNIAI